MKHGPNGGMKCCTLWYVLARCLLVANVRRFSFIVYWIFFCGGSGRFLIKLNFCGGKIKISLIAGTQATAVVYRVCEQLKHKMKFY